MKQKNALTQPIQQQLPEIHPIHGVFLQAFEELGGLERFVEWANENYTDYAKLFARIAPRPQTEINTGEVIITVHPSLGPSALD